MRVEIADIRPGPTKIAILPDISKLGFGESMRARVVSIWEDMGGISVCLWGDFAVGGDAVDPLFAWKRAVVVAP